MPASSGTGRTRVASLKAMSEQEVRRRRTIGEISCAECRRCRIRCDKKVPCGSCVRRGCVTVCPNKTLTAGKGARFVLSDTQDLHSRIVNMSQRIRQLEDALAITTTHSDPNHPLLADHLLSIKFGPETGEGSASYDEDMHEDDTNEGSSIQSMGTFALSTRGEMKYFGPSGGSDALLFAGEELVSAYPEDNAGSASTFPFHYDISNPEKTLDMLEGSLPPRSRAWTLCQIYLEQYSWFFRPISRDELFSEVLEPVYSQKDLRLSSALDIAQRRPHRLAVLLLIFAAACSMDSNLPAFSNEARDYYRLGKAALGLQSVFESPQMETVQAVALAAAFDCNSGMKHSAESSWSCMGLAIKLAMRLGLHREPTKWGNHLTHIDRRRRLFWEIYTIDITQSLVLGRPQGISLAFVDCEFPEDEESPVDENGDQRSDFWTLKYSFARDMFTGVLEQLLNAKPSNYKTILDLDQKIRDMTPPAKFKSGVNVSDAASYTQSQLMQHYITSQYRFLSMLAIHRSSFASALLENAANPLNTPFAPSVLAVNRCASLLIRSLTAQFEQCPELTVRVWYPWAAGFASAMIAGSIVIQSPTSNMAGGSLVDLNSAVELFKKAAVRHCRRAVVAWPFLVRLREKAQLAYTKAQNRDSRTIYLDAQFKSQPDEAKNDEKDEDEKDLATFAGYTKMVSSKHTAHVWTGRKFTGINAPAFEQYQSQGQTQTQTPASCTPPGLPYSPAISTATPTFQSADSHWMTPDIIQYPTSLNGGSCQGLDMEYGGAIMPGSVEQWQSFLLNAGLAGSASSSSASGYYDQNTSWNGPGSVC